MIGVNEDDDPALGRRFRDRYALKYPMLRDPKSAAYRQFRRGHIVESFLPPGLVATPFHVILDRSGVVRYRALGFDQDKIRQTIEELLD